MIRLLAVTIEPILRNSKNENALTPLDSAASIIMMLLAAPNIVRLPAIVLAGSKHHPLRNIISIEAIVYHYVIIKNNKRNVA